MDLTKHFIEKTFKETLQLYSNKIFPILEDIISIKYVDKDYFMNTVKENTLIQQQIQLGLYEDIDKEYPSFIIVYFQDKSPLSLMINGCYNISVCFEIAKKKLKPFTSNQVKEYLKHCFAHEITHIFEDTIIKNDPVLWNKALSKTNNNEGLAKEELAEIMADLIYSNDDYNFVKERLWHLIFKRTKKMQSRKFRGKDIG